jgi:hypothetical protein
MNDVVALRDQYHEQPGLVRLAEHREPLLPPGTLRVAGERIAEDG